MSSNEPLGGEVRVSDRNDRQGMVAITDGTAGSAFLEWVRHDLGFGGETQGPDVKITSVEHQQKGLL